MESTESVHRSFAESMKDNGKEKLLFGMLDMIKDLGGLGGFQESTQINQNNSSINIRAWETERNTNNFLFLPVPNPLSSVKVP